MTTGIDSIERPVDSIREPQNMRPIDDQVVEALCGSIEEVGLLAPLLVSTDGTLLAGRNRLRAVRKLGWSTVPVRVLSNIADEPTTSELATIDENLVRAELTVLQRCQHLLRRKQLFEKLGAGKISTARQNETVSFSADAGRRTGLSQRTIQHELRIAKRLSRKAQKALVGTQMADSKRDLLRLAELHPDGQLEVIETVAAGKARTARDAASRIERKRQQKAISEYELPGGLFDLIVADPPHSYDLRSEDSSHRGRTPYPTMSRDELCAMSVPSAPDSVLCYWTTSAHLLSGDSVAVINAWGFTPKTICVWAKNRAGVGHWLRGQTEYAILAVRGAPRIELRGESTLLFAKVGRHSEKPSSFYEMVEQLFPSLQRRLELFARSERPGWTCSGPEVGAAASLGHSVDDPGKADE